MNLDFIRIIDSKMFYVYPNNNYKPQTALSSSVGTLSLDFDYIYMGSFDIDTIFYILNEAQFLDLTYNSEMIIKGLIKTLTKTKEIKVKNLYEYKN